MPGNHAKKNWHAIFPRGAAKALRDLLRGPRDERSEFCGARDKIVVMKFYYVYVLRNENGNYYIGFSSDLKTRIKDHQRGHTRTTKNHVYQLIYYEAYRNKADALGREKFLKGGSGRKYLKKQLLHFFTEQ